MLIFAIEIKLSFLIRFVYPELRRNWEAEGFLFNSSSEVCMSLDSLGPKSNKCSYPKFYYNNLKSFSDRVNLD